MRKKPKISIIIPAKDEEESVVNLHKKIVDSLKKVTTNYEIVFVEDGSKDKTFENLKKIKRKDKRVIIIKHRGNFGKSIALQNGFQKSSGDIVFTMDADLQDDPKEIPNFLKMLDEGYDMISGWKKTRHDPKISKVIPSRIINWLASKITGVTIHDTNCGFKVYRREVVENLNLYGELYRFIPIMAAKMRFKIGEIPIKHHARKHGKSKFGWSRSIKGILDLITVFFLTGFIQRPSHFFGALGIASFSVGFTIGLYITYLRITTGSIQYRHPLLFLGILLIVIGVQLFTTGLLAEMMIHSENKRDYSSTVKEVI